MARASPMLENFNTGELSPMLAGRVGFEKYPNGASLLRNFIPTTQGPHVRRAGFRYVGSTKGYSKVLLVPFEYSASQAYVLEFGHLYVRFYTWDSVTKVRGTLESSPGVPVELVTPYTLADLYNTDGTPRLRFTQSADFLYLAHSGHTMRVLRRVTATSFALDLFEPKGGPWATLNDSATTVYASAQEFSVTLQASSGIFVAGHVGALMLLESKDVGTIKAWEVGQPITAGDRRRSDGKTYEALNTGKTGTNRPVHTEGAQFDGGEAQPAVPASEGVAAREAIPVSVQWAYRDPGYGYVRITAVISATQASAEVIDRLPVDVVGIDKATTRWAFGEWSGANGWPSDVAFFRERLWFGSRQKVWGSVAGDFNDFSPKAFGEVTPDMGITITLVSGKNNDLQWLAADKDLIAGTAGAEFAIGELTNGEPIGPNNRRSRLMSEFGSRGIPPVKNADSVMFVQRSGLKARETFYDFSGDGYKSADLTVLADHVTQSGITQMVYAPDPDQVVWCVRNDGQLLGFTWNNEQNVRGWHPHAIGGDGVVESIATIPAAEGDRSELWAVVRRTIGGQVRRYVEYLERPWRIGDAQADQFYVDSGLTYRGAATQTISGLDHLEGCTVSVLSDGAPHPDVVVSGGDITLQRAASVVQVGLPCPARYRSMRLEAGGSDGVAQGKTKRIHEMTIRLLNTGGGRYGPLLPGRQMDSLLLRPGSAPMGQPAPLFTGDKTVTWPQGYDKDAYVGFEVEQPVAATLVAFMPKMVTA